jgi:hypothetical protein
MEVSMQSSQCEITYQPHENGGVVLHLDLPLNEVRECGFDKPPVHLMLAPNARGLYLSKDRDDGAIVANDGTISVCEDIARFSFHLSNRQFKRLKRHRRQLVSAAIDLSPDGELMLSFPAYTVVAELLGRRYYLVVIHGHDIVITEDQDLDEFFTPVLVNGIWKNECGQAMYMDKNCSPHISPPSNEHVRLTRKRIRSRLKPLMVFEASQSAWERLVSWTKNKQTRRILESN